MKLNKKYKIVKIKIMNTNIDIGTKLIGKETEIQIFKPKRIPGDIYPQVKRSKTTKELLVEFIDKQLDFNKSIKNEITNLNNKIDNLNTKLDRVIKLNNLKY